MIKDNRHNAPRHAGEICARGDDGMDRRGLLVRTGQVGALVAAAAATGSVRPAPALAESPDPARHVPRGRILIRGGAVLSVDDTIGNIGHGDVLIDHGVIQQVGRNLPSAGADVIDARGNIVLPGFVDGHRHTQQVLIRNLNASYTFEQYFRLVLGVIAPLQRPEEMYSGNLLGALEAIDVGITTVQDWCFGLNTPDHADSAIAGLADAGIRAVFGYGPPLAPFADWWRNSTLRHPEDARRVQARYFSSTDQLLTLALSLRGPEFTTADTTRQDFAFARDLGVPITVHIQAANTIRAMSDVLGPDTLYVHCTASDSEELDLIRKSGGRINVCPEAEMGLHDQPITNAILEHGMLPSLGIDSAAPFSGDMFVQMRMAMQEARMEKLHAAVQAGTPLQELPPGLSPGAALRWATLEGARAFGLENRIGSLTPGKRADIVILSGGGLQMTPLNEPVGAAVTSAGPRDVDTVIIDGKVRKWRGQLVGADLNRARRLAVASRDYLFAAGGIPENARWYFEG